MTLLKTGPGSFFRLLRAIDRVQPDRYLSIFLQHLLERYGFSPSTFMIFHSPFFLADRRTTNSFSSRSRRFLPKLLLCIEREKKGSQCMFFSRLKEGKIWKGEGRISGGYVSKGTASHHQLALPPPPPPSGPLIFQIFSSGLLNRTESRKKRELCVSTLKNSWTAR